ncbi:MAG: hemolysin family protein, partial [Chloroflexota bacterium]
ITLASLGLGMYAEEAIAGWLIGPAEHIFHLTESAAHGVAAAVALGILTFLHVVIGEMVPKSLALSQPEKTVFGIFRPMRWSQLVFGPAVKILNGMGSLILRLMGVPIVEGHARVHSPDELRMIIQDSFKNGQLDESERLMLGRAFDFSELRAHQVMMHRTRIEGYPVDISEDALLSAVSESRFSRFPIYENNLDHIIGILHLKDLIRQQIHSPGEFQLRDMLRRAPVVPEAARVTDILASLKRLRMHMALVLDEYGGTAGIVTLEDLVEEVVGEVQDEFDQEVPLVRRTGDQQFMVRGDLPLDELGLIAPIGKELPDVNSIGGLIVHQLDRMPQIGDTVEFSGVTMQVVTVVERSVRLVRLTVPAIGNSETGEDETLVDLSS